MRTAEGRKMFVLEINRLISLVEVSRMNRLRNEVVRR